MEVRNLVFVAFVLIAATSLYTFQNALMVSHTGEVGATDHQLKVESGSTHPPFSSEEEALPHEESTKHTHNQSSSSIDLDDFPNELDDFLDNESDVEANSIEGRDQKPVTLRSEQMKTAMLENENQQLRQRLARFVQQGMGGDVGLGENTAVQKEADSRQDQEGSDGPPPVVTFEEKDVPIEHAIAQHKNARVQELMALLKVKEDALAERDVMEKAARDALVETQQKLLEADQRMADARNEAINEAPPTEARGGAPTTSPTTAVSPPTTTQGTVQTVSPEHGGGDFCSQITNPFVDFPRASRRYCLPFDKGCRTDARAKENACEQEQVLSRFYHQHKVFWVPDLRHADDWPIMSESGVVKVEIHNCGDCVKNCHTHLWGRLIGTDRQTSNLTIGGEVLPEQESDRLVTMSFQVDVPGSYRLELENRVWYSGNSASEAVDRHEFEFGARNLDMYTHEENICCAYKDAKNKPYPPELEHGAKYRSGIRDLWRLTNCLGLYKSPFDVIFKSAPQAVVERNLARTEQKLPYCGVKDLEEPGRWAPMPSSLNGNDFLDSVQAETRLRKAYESYGSEGRFYYPPLRKIAFLPRTCQWRNLTNTDVKQCMSRINGIFFHGDSLLRQKIEKLVAVFQVPATKISGADVTPGRDFGGIKGFPIRAAGASKGLVDVVVDDMRLSHRSWTEKTKAIAAAAEAGPPMGPGKTVGVFYRSHYVNEYKCDKIIEPRMSELGALATEVYRKKDYHIFDTQHPTRPMAETMDTIDGLHFGATVDTFLTFMLLHGICEEIDPYL